jgi:hypothetical protein
MTPLVVHRLARAELSQASKRYEQESKGLGARFLSAVDDILSASEQLSLRGLLFSI